MLQVGVFASHYVGHLAERDLIATAPPLFLCLAIWLDLGAPRTVRRTLLVTGVALVTVLAWPLHTLLAPDALPDAASLIPFHRLGHQRLLLDGGLVVAGLVLILAPARVLRAVPYVLIALLGIGSVMAEQYAASQSRLSQRTMLGPQQTWIDHAASRETTLLYGDKNQWPAVWQSLFWNRKLIAVYALPGAKLIGPAPGGYVGLANDGSVLVAGRPLQQRYAVSELGLIVNGTPVADAGSAGGGTVAPWRLWQLDGPLRLAARTGGVQPNGDIYQDASVHAFNCPGTLRLTLLAKQDEQINLYRQGVLYRTIPVKLGGRALKVLHLGVATAPGAQGPCDFGITSTGLLGSTVIAFDPAS